jgi:hypothetical protein
MVGQARLQPKILRFHSTSVGTPTSDNSDRDNTGVTQASKPLNTDSQSFPIFCLNLVVRSCRIDGHVVRSSRLVTSDLSTSPRPPRRIGNYCGSKAPTAMIINIVSSRICMFTITAKISHCCYDEAGIESQRTEVGQSVRLQYINNAYTLHFSSSRGPILIGTFK